MYIDGYKIFDSRTFNRDKGKIEENIKELISEIFNDLELESNKINIEIKFESSKKHLYSNISIKLINPLDRKERISISKFIKNCIDKSIEIDNTSLRSILVFGQQINKTYHDQQKFLSSMSRLIDTILYRSNIERISIHLTSKIETKWMPPFRKRLNSQSIKF
jgi:hypothetical protein